MLLMVSVGAWAEKITDPSKIVSGHKYFIGATTDGTDYYFSTDCSTLSNSVDGTAVTSKSEATVIQFIKDNNSGKWNLKFDGTDYYLALNKAYPLPSSEKGHVQVVSSPTNFSITTENNLLRIGDGNCLQKDNNSNDFGVYNYAAGQTNVWLEAVPSTATITLNSACTDGSKVYGTYSNTSAWVVPSFLNVSEIGVNDGTLNAASYSTGAVVPANTGVMVSAVSGGNYTVELSSVAGTSILGNNNCLRPTGNGITAAQMAQANTEFYRLTMHNGTQIGFWWGAENGAAFDLGVNKAYLAVATDNLGLGESARTGLWFDDNEEELESIEIDATTTIYTLDGMKVNELQKGLNIVNDKKIFVK